MTNDELMMMIGNNLRKYRIENNLTQEELAEQVGISTSFYANLERGKKGMSIFVFRRLADALGISSDYLLYEETSIARTHNINNLLCNRSERTIVAIEKLVRLCLEEFESKK